MTGERSLRHVCVHVTLIANVINQLLYPHHCVHYRRDLTISNRESYILCADRTGINLLVEIF